MVCYDNYYQSDFTISEKRDTFYSPDNVVPGSESLILKEYPYLIKKFKRKDGIGILRGMRWDIWQETKEKLQKKISIRIIATTAFCRPRFQDQSQFQNIRKI